MNHMDEQILDIINQAEKADRDIHKGPIKIGNRYYEFEGKKFFDERVKIYIPKDFIEMPQNLKEIKYPSNNRPEIIKTDETGSINITLNRIDSDLDEESVEELTHGMKMIIKRINPSNTFYDEGIEKVNEKNIGYFEFKSSALDDFVYNLMFFFEFYGKTIMGTFSCLYNECTEWKDIAFQVLKTVMVVKEVEKI